MQITRNEIERLFPSVYITRVSILLGFAVEDVITRLRELAPFDTFTLLAAAGILTAIMAGWIGYSFSSMTQERLPRVWDAVHVFFLAIAAWMSMKGIPLNSMETFLIVYFSLSNIAWIYFLNKGWSGLIADMS